MKKLFKIKFEDDHELFAAAQDFERIASTYENAKSIELIDKKCEVIKDRERHSEVMINREIDDFLNLLSSSILPSVETWVKYKQKANALRNLIQD